MSLSNAQRQSRKQRRKKMSLEDTFADTEHADDPMAVLIRDLDQLKEYHLGITQLLPRVLTTLRRERLDLLRDAEKRWTDLWSRIDVFCEGDEDSWVTAMRILDHYRDTYKAESSEGG